MNRESRRFSKFLIGSSLGILIVLTILNFAVFGQSQVNMISRTDDIQIFTEEFEFGEAHLVIENYIENSEEDYRLARVGVELRSTGDIYVVGLIDYDLTFFIDAQQESSQNKPIYGYFYQDSIEEVQIKPGEHLSVKGTVNAYFVVEGDIEKVQFSVEIEYNMEFTPIYEELPLVLVVTFSEVLLFIASASLLYLGQQWKETRKSVPNNWLSRVLLPKMVDIYQ